MGVFTFIAKQAGGSWSAKAYSKDDGYDEALTAEAATTAELERALVELAKSKSSGGGVQLSFNQITPKSAVVVVSIGATAVAAAAPAAGGAAPAAGGGAAPAAKKEEPSEEDEDMGFSLFD